MYEFIVVIAFILSITALPWWLFRRMKAVQSQAYDKVQQKKALQFPVTAPTDETVSQTDGLANQLRSDVNQPLIDADNAMAVPDINKTLSGNR